MTPVKEDVNGETNSVQKTNGFLKPPPPLNLPPLEVLGSSLVEKLFSTSAEAKIWGVASRALNQGSPPRFYPEYTKPGGSDYVYRDLEFWTSGFFPGILHLLLERRRLLGASGDRPHTAQFEHACKWWTENLHQNASLKGTHDLGFMVMPWAYPEWKLNQSSRALETMKSAAQTLLSRFSPTVGCIRSWDKCQTQHYNFSNPDADFLTVIDNMMNLSLLFLVAEQTHNASMRAAAVQHARTTSQTHMRADASTTHLVVFCPQTGRVKDKLTNQGLAHSSCWARGQAWAIAGFAETFGWTRDDEFLATARRCADYFLRRLPASGVAPWDFDAAGEVQPPDTSATMIAAYGMLLIHRALASRGEGSPYLGAALRLADAVCTLHLNPPAEYVAETEAMETVEHGVVQVQSGVRVDMNEGETILNGATINNYEFAPRRWANHGLVYADYYFLLFGNELLKTNLASFLAE